MRHLNTLLDGIKPTSYYSNFWLSIEDMPISCWMKIIETGDLKYLFKNGKGRVSERCIEHWQNLQQQYIDEFGLDENYKKILRLEAKLISLNCDFVLTRDRHLLNLIKITEFDIKGSKQGESMKFYQMLDLVEKYKGFAIDPDNYSVKKWYYTLKNMSNGEAN